MSDRMTVEEYRAELRKMGIDPGPSKAAVKPAEFRDQPEKVFQSWIIKEAEARGWKVYHTYDSRRCAAGFPDLVMCRTQEGYYRGQTLFAEIKTQTGRVSKEQQEWIDALIGGNNMVYVWRPSDIDEILEVLK